jgi:hypothetical protein
MRMMMQPSTLVGELSLCFCFLAVILERFFRFVLVLCSKRSSSLSSSRAQVSITPSLARGGDDVFSATMPPSKPLVWLGGFSMKRKMVK